MLYQYTYIIQNYIYIYTHILDFRLYIVVRQLFKIYSAEKTTNVPFSPSCRPQTAQHPYRHISMLTMHMSLSYMQPTV
jgi:hypothetical protein